MTQAITRGQTALVTGASSGLGAEFARQLAARGAHLVLVARRQDRLEELARELREAHGVSVRVVPLDLTAPTAAATLLETLGAAGVSVDVLVNNAGFGTYGPFADEDLDRIVAETQLNVTAVTALSRAFFPQLLAAGNGLLVNVSSTAAYQPIPHIAVYAATKAYVRSLTEALWYEARGTGLRVIALAPGPTHTEFFEAAGSDKFAIGQVLAVPDVVGAVFRALERRNPPPSVVAGVRNKVTAVAGRFVPRRVLIGASGRLAAP